MAIQPHDGECDLDCVWDGWVLSDHGGGIWVGRGNEEEYVQKQQEAWALEDDYTPLWGAAGVTVDAIEALPNDAKIRTFGRTIGSALIMPAVSIPLGIGVTLLPNQVENYRIHKSGGEMPWYHVAGDAEYDLTGFIVSEVAGWAGGSMASRLGPQAGIVGTFVSDIRAGIAWEANEAGRQATIDLYRNVDAFARKVGRGDVDFRDYNPYSPPGTIRFNSPGVFP